VTKVFNTRLTHFNLTEEYGIKLMPRRGNCYDNAMAENFFDILKSEFINRQKIKDFATAKYLIEDYIFFYNHERIQLESKLTPLELRRQLYS